MRNRGLVWVIVAVFLLASLGAGCQPGVTPPEATKAPVTAASPQATAKPAATPDAGAKPAVSTPQATAKPAAATPVKGGTLRVYLPGNPGSTDPAYVTGADRAVSYALYDPLFAYDEDNEPTTNGLVESYEVAKDGLSILLKLRKGVKFHDGTDFNAEAVKFNLERILDPKTKSPVAEQISDIKKIDVVDPLTVRLNLGAPSAPLLSNLAFLPGMMASPTAVKKYGEDFGRNPVGAGPFQFVEWVQGDHVTVKRFDGYWMKDHPYLDQITWKIIPDAAAGVMALRSGDLDEDRYVSGSDLVQIRQDPKLRLSIKTQTSWWGMYINTTAPPFNNKLVRQALAWAIDREGAAKAVFGADGAVAISTPLLPGTAVYDPNAKPYMPRDLAKAKALLAQAGYPNGFKTTLTTSTKKAETLLAQVYQQNLAEIGVNVEVEILENARRTELRDQLNYKLLISGSAQVGDADSMMIRFLSGSTRGNTGYSNPKVDEMLMAARSSYDPKERIQLYRDMAKIVADDVPAVFVYAENLAIGLSNRIQGFTHYSDAIQRYRDVWLQP